MTKQWDKRLSNRSLIITFINLTTNKASFLNLFTASHFASNASHYQAFYKSDTGQIVHYIRWRFYNGSQFQPKHVAVNKLIRLLFCLTVLVCILWFVNTSRELSS